MTQMMMHAADLPPLVAGVDEAGRGPLAGPVVAASVILNPADIPTGLNDSKKLSAKKREALYDEITRRAVAYHIHAVDEATIDSINILQATLQAMQQAVLHLTTTPKSVVIDGNKAPKLPYPNQTIIKGDASHLSIAAASILAKVARDRTMQQLAQAFPHYGWQRNAGYGTKEHLAAIAQHGATPHHRMSFAPLKHMHHTISSAA